MIKLFFNLVLLCAVFVAGYYLGTSDVGGMTAKYRSLKEAMTGKTEALEAQVSSLRLRRNISEVQRHMERAVLDIQAQNFGAAQEKIDAAKDSMDRAVAMASNPQRTMLSSLQPEMESIRTDIQNLQLAAIPKIASVAKVVEQVLASLVDP